MGGNYSVAVKYIFENFPVGMLQCNCSIIGDPDTLLGLVIDPGDEASHIISVINRHKLKLKYILLTHAHIDHIGGVGQIKEMTGAEILLHPGDLQLYEGVSMQAEWVGVKIPLWKPLDRHLSDNDVIKLGALELNVIHTPGHSPGGVTFFLASAKPLLFTGDTLFQGSIGRTDLWGGSFETLIDSIKNRLLSFPDETIVYPGHGQKTTIGNERRSNPFIIGSPNLYY